MDTEQLIYLRGEGMRRVRVTNLFPWLLGGRTGYDPKICF